MVIFIDESIYERLKNLELKEDENIFFSNLAFAHRQGKCYLCGNIMSIEYLSQALEGPAAGIYRQIMSRHSESGEILNLVEKVLVLAFTGDVSQRNFPSALMVDGKPMITPVETAMQWNLDRPCCLLGEDLSDCNFYKSMGEYFLKKRLITSLHIAVHSESGGGSSLGDGLKKCVSEDLTPTLCIVDSDRKFGAFDENETLPKGNTLKTVENVSEELKNVKGIPPFVMFPLDVHEAENLIPTCILHSIKKPDVGAGLVLLDKLKNLFCGKPALYYDLKKGFPYIADGAQRRYWTSILLTLGGHESDMPPKTKEEAKQLGENSFFPHVIGRKALDEAVKSMQKKTLAGDFVIDDHLHMFWDAIGALVLTWGCANMPASA